MADPAPASPTHVRLSLLGPFEATAGGAPVPLGGPRQRAVLARLALAGGDVVPFERLVDELWDGDPPASARNTVQSYVSNLRRAFAGDGELIERVGPGYRVAVAPDQIDLRRFEDLVAAAGEPGTDPGRRYEILDDALGLWRGPALADVADHGWARADIVRLDELRLGAMEARFDALIDLGRHVAIVGELEHAVRSYPLRERFCGQLMLALFRSGRQADALRAYERTREHLLEELGLDPGPELQRLAGAILSHDAWLDDATVSSSRAAGAPEPERPPVRALPALTVGPCRRLVERPVGRPFVGRRDEVVVLEQAWDHVVREGRPQIAVVTGEAGVGKTRLVRHVVRTLEAGGAQVLWGRCTTDPDVSYQPIVDALADAFADIEPSALAATVEARPGLAPLLAPLLGASDHLVGLDRSAGHLEVYEAAAQILTDHDDAPPTVLVIDDAQWSDAASLHLVDHLLARGRTERVLVLLTVRRPAGRATDDLDHLIAGSRRDGRLVEVELGGMDVEDVERLLETLAIDDGAALAPTVQQRTAGNPFYIEQLALAGEGSAAFDELPPSVRSVIELRLAALDDETRSVLVAAAVLGARAPVETLAAVTGASAAQVLDHTDRATAAGALVDDADIGWVAFPHALVRQTVLAGATRNRVAQLHLQAADALSAGPRRAGTAAAVAAHCFDAGALCPLDRRVEAGLAAAASSAAALAPEVTLNWVDRVRSALDHEEPGADLTPRFTAHLLAAAAHRHLGDRERSTAEAWSAVDVARRLADPVRLAEATDAVGLSKAGIGFDFGEFDQRLLDLLDEALAAIGPDPSAPRAMLLAWGAAARTGAHDPLQDQLSAEAVRVAAELDDPVVLARASFARQLACSGPNGLVERLTRGPITSAAAVQADDVELEVVALVLRIVDLLEADRVDESSAALEQLRARLAPLQRPSFDAYLGFLDANQALLRGDLAAADTATAAAIAAGSRAHGGNAGQAWAAQQFLLAWFRGHLPELTPVLAAMAEDQPEMPVWHATLAATLVAGGDRAAASELSRQLGATASTFPYDAQWTVTMALLAEVAWSVDDAATGAAAASLINPFVDHVAVTAMGAACVGPLHRARGLALAAAGDLDGSLASLEVAVRRSRRDRFYPWLARALHDQTAVLLRRNRRGDRSAAAQSRSEADALARRLGITLALAPW